MKAIPYLRALRGRLKRRKQYSFFPEFMVTMPSFCEKKPGNTRIACWLKLCKWKHYGPISKALINRIKGQKNNMRPHHSLPTHKRDFTSCLPQTANDRKTTWPWFFHFCGLPFLREGAIFPLTTNYNPRQFCWEGCQILPFLRFVPLSLLQCWI